jgi:hypothetical protein
LRCHYELILRDGHPNNRGCRWRRCLGWSARRVTDTKTIESICQRDCTGFEDDDTDGYGRVAPTFYLFHPRLDARVKSFAEANSPANVTRMQEEVLSTRILVFIDSQVYYRCSRSHYSESLTSPENPLLDQRQSLGSMFYGIFAGPKAIFNDFSIIVRYYTVRKLSFQSDILRAAQGMLRKYSTLSGLQCFEGLPAPLDRSLLFNKSSVNSEVYGRRKGFPSYSWTGWKSVPEYSDYLEAEELSISNISTSRESLLSLVQVCGAG